MIVCSCNVLSDHDVRVALAAGEDEAPRTASQVYGCLGYNLQCGRCVRTIRAIMDEAMTLVSTGSTSASRWRGRAPGR
jgi:bacterioferritin-associated ferredoxin